MQLEICVDSLQSAINAEKGAADRIELCSALSEGGLSPSLAFMEKVKSSISIPVYVLVRPRAGNFVYSSAEKEIISNEIDYYKEAGADGFVIGALDNEKNIDLDFIKMLSYQIGEKSKTFHRAIDVSRKANDIIDQCIDLGFDRILSSGLKSKAINAIDELVKMKEYANGRISIMPASGINEENIDLFLNKGFKDIHMSLRTDQRLKDEMGFSDLYFEADLNRIKSVKKKLKKTV